MKGPFFYHNLMSYYILKEDGFNFNDVDASTDKIRSKYNVEIKEKIEIPCDCYYIIANIDEKYIICVEAHYTMGITIASENEESKNMVTEIANYLNKELFK